VRQQDLLPKLRKELATIPGAFVFAAPYPIVGGQRGEPLQFVLAGENLQEVGRLSRELQQRLAQVAGIGRLDTDLQLDLPQLVFQPDRARIAAAQLSSQDVALAVNMLTGGIDIAKFNDEPGDGQRYDIRVKGREGEFTQPSDLSKIWLRAKDGKLVRLDSVASFGERLGPAVIGRFDLQYAATFYASPTIPLGEAVAKLRDVAAEILPAGYQVKLVGQAEEFGKTQKYMTFAFSLALVLLYMVLASQFNSFLQPAIIMLAQPLAIIGGVAALWLFGQTLNIYSMIGLVLLIGLVAKNSILLVDLTNQRREGGLAVDAALRDACPTRMRPVLMTSATVILALFPAALGLGAGAETNQPLSIAVIGGMISSTLLTLVVVPAVYSLVEAPARPAPMKTAPAGAVFHAANNSVLVAVIHGRRRGQVAHLGLDLDRLHLLVLALDLQRDGHYVALLQLLLELHQHDVVAAGRQLDALAGGQVELGDGAHLHDAAFHAHGVQFDHPGYRTGGRQQHGRIAAGDLHEGASGLLRRCGAARPGVFHADVRQCGKGKDGEAEGGDDGFLH
jgi:hypothetical protein